jgi:hypothetical protein
LRSAIAATCFSTLGWKISRKGACNEAVARSFYPDVLPARRRGKREVLQTDALDVLIDMHGAPRDIS